MPVAATASADKTCACGRSAIGGGASLCGAMQSRFRRAFSPDGRLLATALTTMRCGLENRGSDLEGCRLAAGNFSQDD
jgi:hypothetical protein